MALEIGQIEVQAVVPSSRTVLERRTLGLDLEALGRELQAAVDGLARVEVHVVAPGEAARVLCVKDVIEPRAKVDGAPLGSGRTHALTNVAVVTSGRIVGFQEGILDTTGPGARHPWTATWLVVVEADPVADLDPHRHEAALRQVGLAAAERLGTLAADAEPDAVEVVDWGERPVPPGVPRIAYVYPVLSQGLLHDTYVEGVHAAEALPRLLHPATVLDGAVVSGNCVSACDKNTTWHHQRNAALRALLARHGEALELVGVVATDLPTRLADKEASAREAARLTRSLRPDGALVTKEGFGNPDADLVMLVRLLEADGIRTVAISDEFAGPDGASPSLADTATELDAVVSTGNANERIVVPPVARTIGPSADVDHLAGASGGGLLADGSREVELQLLVGATNELGHGRLTAVEV